MNKPNYNEPIEGEVCGMPMEAYAITTQLLYDEGCISNRDVRRIASFVELDRHSPQFMLELPKLIHKACERWLEKMEGKELDEDEKTMDALVRTLEKTTAAEIRKAVS